MASKKRTKPQSRKKTAKAVKSTANNALRSKHSKKKVASAKKKKLTGKTKKGKQSTRKMPSVKSGATTGAKRAKKKVVVPRRAAKPKARKSTRAAKVTPKKSTRPPRLSTFSAAVKVYAAGVKLMQSERFTEANATFEGLIKQYPSETELIDRANVLIQACDNRIQEAKKSPRLRGADQYYEIGITELNNHELDQALEHLQEALKLSPKADHVLYALAAASALNGQREAALDFLAKAIARRDENRFLAINDDDFESLAEDVAFIELTTPSH